MCVKRRQMATICIQLVRHSHVVADYRTLHGPMLF